MKPETDPIAPDEWLLRLVWKDRMGPPAISPTAFEPRDERARAPDTDGISLYREDCLSDPREVLKVLKPEKQPGHGIVRIPVSLLLGLGLTVKPSRVSEVPGHVVIPEMSAAAYGSNKSQIKKLMGRLAEAANDNVVHRPADT